MGDDSSLQSVTELLDELRAGEQSVADELFDRVYTDLRQRARAQRRQWKGDPTLGTTALVNEAYLKLVDQEEQSWESRSHFFAVVAQKETVPENTRVFANRRLTSRR